MLSIQVGAFFLKKNGFTKNNSCSENFYEEKLILIRL